MFLGIVLVLIGLAAIGLGGSLSWVMFAFLIWGCIALFGGGGRKKHARKLRKQYLAAQVAPAPPSRRAPAPASLPAPPANRLPATIQLKVERIKRKAALLGQHADRFPLGSKDLYVVQHTTTDYLPATLGAYLEVPPWSVNAPVAPDGRTAVKVLDDQLDMLETKLDEIAQNVQRQRVDRLLANERFLEENFGKREPAELTIPQP
jgi:hypothetical protein